MRSASFCVVSLAVPQCLASIWTLSRLTSGASFFNDFTFQTFKDPTHGRVNYVDEATAISDGLAYVSQDGKQFTMRADATKVVALGDRGRDSIRIASKATYRDSVLVLDVEHMPAGCGTWPAWWTVTRGHWPQGGEIDIIEGVNAHSFNLGSLHTGPGCTASRPLSRMTGTSGFRDCDAHQNHNTGCNIRFNKGNNYGQPFNKAGGGWFAMRRSKEHGISMWFWSREEHASVPLEVQEGGALVNPDEWGTPEAVFPVSGCDVQEHFDEHEIVFDLTFCGDFAGGDYPLSGCPGTCVDLVDNHPEAFKQAFWTINSLRTYVMLLDA